ncbi:vegetative incompatibility protein HET-E-1 [Paraphaeosphaeria sporulosa]
MDSYLHQGLLRAMMEKGKGLRAAPVQVIFTSTNSFLSTVPGFQKELKSTLKIHQFFFDRIYLQSNGFCGHEVWLDDNEKVECYTYWSRFTVKQTYDKLRAKRTYTPHISNHHSGAGDWNADVAIHGPQSVRHGWEWYEMGFFASWTPSGSITLLCFDLPVTLEKDIQSMFCSQGVSRWCPYAVFSLVSDALLRLYDDSVWTVRNHISQWEARRSQEADYILLHEIARHGIHISETLSVAIRSLDAMQHHHAKFRTYNDLVRSKKGCENWDRVGTHFEFQLRFLQGLFQRSEANNARIQNEITLAGKFVTSIAVQLADNITTCRQHIRDVIAERSNIAQTSLRDQWQHLVLRPLSQLHKPGPFVIVIDALDECDNDNDVQIIVRLLAEARWLDRVRVRVFLTSRPEVPIRDVFGQIKDTEYRDFVLHDISPSIVNQDIRLFLEMELQSIS